MSERLTFSEAQGKQMRFLHERNLNTTIDTQAEKLGEEVPEMLEALAVLQSDYTTEHEKDLALEIVDVIIVGMGLIGEMGLDTGELVLQKLAKTDAKYPLSRVIELQLQGHSPYESMRIIKQEYGKGGELSA